MPGMGEEMWVELIDFFSEFVSIPNKHDIYDFYRDHAGGAIVIAFILFGIIAAVLTSIVFDVFHGLSHLWDAVPGKLVIVAFLLLCGAAAYWSKTEVPTLLEPVPVLTADQTSVVRNPVVLKWTYDGEPSDAPVVYQVESADDNEFNKLEPPQSTDGNSWFSYQEGTKWWRVRVKHGERVGQASNTEQRTTTTLMIVS